VRRFTGGWIYACGEWFRYRPAWRLRREGCGRSCRSAAIFTMSLESSEQSGIRPPKAAGLLPAHRTGHLLSLGRTPPGLCCRCQVGRAAPVLRPGVNLINGDLLLPGFGDRAIQSPQQRHKAFPLATHQHHRAVVTGGGGGHTLDRTDTPHRDVAAFFQDRFDVGVSHGMSGVGSFGGCQSAGVSVGWF